MNGGAFVLGYDYQSQSAVASHTGTPAVTTPTPTRQLAGKRLEQSARNEHTTNLLMDLSLSSTQTKWLWHPLQKHNKQQQQQWKKKNIPNSKPILYF